METENKSTATRRIQTAILMTAAAVAYFVTARLSLYLAFGNTNATPVWPPSGIALAVMLLWGYRMGPAVFAGAFFANVLALQEASLGPVSIFTVSLTTALGNMLEGLLGVWCIRRLTGTNQPFDTIKDLFVFIIFAGLLCTMLSATIGSVSFSVAAGQWATIPPMWLTWWLGDAAGILIVSPIIIMLKMKMTPELTRARLWEAAIFFVFLTAFVIVIFGGGYRLEYALIPPLVWIAVRFGRLPSAAAVALVSSIAVASAVGGAGALADLKTGRSLFYLQTYIGVISIIVLCLSVLTHSHKQAESNLRSYKDHLEETVEERSAALVRANEQLVRQVEALNKAGADLSESEKKYRDLVESANSVILRWKPDGSVTFFNRFAQKFFGFTEREILGRNIVGTIVPALESSGRDLAWLIDDIVRHPEGHAFNENENIRKSGEKVWMAWTNKPVFDESGRLEEILSVGNDITIRKHIEESLKKTLEELAAAKDRAEEADRIKSAFLAAMSHELRTPLNSIIGFTGILLQEFAGPLNDEQKKQLAMVQGSSRHLLSLINDVLDISKIEAGQLTLTDEPFNLRAAIEKIADSLKPALLKKNLRLDVRIAEDICIIAGDQRRIEQVLLNLLSNAVKFTEEGGVELSADIVLYALKDPSSPAPAVKFCVTDTGIGIRAEDLKILFEPFRQLDSGVARKHEGTGLGLNICRRLADLMGGEISASSVWGKGSAFTFILPLKGGNPS